MSKLPARYHASRSPLRSRNDSWEALKFASAVAGMTVLGFAGGAILSDSTPRPATGPVPIYRAPEPSVDSIPWGRSGSATSRYVPVLSDLESELRRLESLERAHLAQTRFEIQVQRNRLNEAAKNASRSVDRAWNRLLCWFGRCSTAN